jgi:crossover junction endodeoxyribonuclease RuvC
MKVLGVDPGIHGGLAIVEIIDGAAPQIIAISDIPVAGVGAKERVDPLAVAKWIQTHQPDHAVIERAQAMPKQGASSGFKYGRSVGAIEAVIACCEIPMRSSNQQRGRSFTICTRHPARLQQKSKK